MCQMRLADAVEKFAVVRDDEHGGGLAPQPGFEPDDRVEVEVVRRLVEQQQIGRAEQRPRQRQPVAPTARERRDRAVRVARSEAEPPHHRLRSREDCALVQFSQRSVRMSKAHFIVARFGLRQFLARSAERRMAGQHEIDRVLVRSLDILCDVSDPLGTRSLDDPGLGSEFAEQRCEQGRLAAAVRADEADALARPGYYRDAAVQRAGAACEGNVDQPQHRQLPGGVRPATAVPPAVPERPCRRRRLS